MRPKSSWVRGGGSGGIWRGRLEMEGRWPEMGGQRS